MSIHSETSDGRRPLPAGSVIIGSDGTRYTIKSGNVGCGGSALVYQASRSNSRCLFVVKECYPAPGKYKFTRRDGVVCPENADNSDAWQYLNLMKKDMERENEIGQIIATATGRVVAPGEDLNAAKIILGGETYAAAESFFIVMEQIDKKNNNGWFLSGLLEECAKPVSKNFPLRTGGLPAPYVVVCVMEELLKSLRDIHSAGYVHADIQDSNFFLMGNEPRTGDIGVGMLLDFGNARKLEADGMTAEISDKRILFTRGYCAPEILYGNDGTLRLTPAADIFSAGCLMLYLLKGMDYRDRWGAGLTKLLGMSAIFSAEDAMERGFNRKAALLVEEILTNALELEPEDRYQNASEMLDKILELKKLSAPVKFQLAKNLSRSPYWVERSRDAELARLQKYLAEGKQPLYIWGIGGIGKTELAMEFARRQPEQAYLVTFRGTMRETVMQMDFANYVFRYDGVGDPQSQEYCERLNILRTDYAGCLLIVDNFDSETADISRLQQEPAFKDIVGLDLHVLFTTRSRPDNVTPELSAFSEKSAFELFAKIVYDDLDGARKISIDAEEEKIIRQLLREIEYHPLTVELAAKAVCDSWNTVTPRELLNRLRFEIPHKSGRTEKVYAQVRELFRVYEFDESYRQILAHMTLLPTDGIDAALILGSEDGTKKNQLKRIERRGFVRRRKENNRLLIHPLIRSVIKNELKPVEADCEEFLAALWKKFEEQYPPDISQNKQAAELYDRAAKDLQDSRGLFTYRAGHCHIVAGNDAIGSLRIKWAIDHRENLPEDYELALMYSDIALASMKISPVQESLTFYNKALEILRNVAPDSAEFANTLASIGDFYGRRWNFSEALKYAAQAVELMEQNPPPKKDYLAHAHNTLANALAGVDRPREALPHLETAVKIIENLSPAVGSPDLAILYSNLGNINADAGNFDAALNYVQRAIDMQVKILSQDHRDTINSYIILSNIYHLMGQRETADAYSEKVSEILQRLKIRTNERMLKVALEILEYSKKAFAKNLETRAGLSHNYRRVAGTYRNLGDKVNAEKNIVLAIETLGNDSSSPIDIILNYTEASDIYCDMKNFDRALEYAFKALDAMNPTDFENLAMIYMKIANLYVDLGRNDDAQRYYAKSREMELSCAAPDYSSVKILDARIVSTGRGL